MWPNAALCNDRACDYGVRFGLAFVFARFVPEFVFEFEFMFDVLPVFMFDGVAVGVGVEVVFMFARLVLALFTVLFAAGEPQANPRALSAKTDESAITFFIFIFSLLSFSKIKFIYFYLPFGLLRNCPKFLGNLGQTQL